MQKKDTNNNYENWYQNCEYLQIFDTFENHKSFRVDFIYFVVLQVSAIKHKVDIKERS